MPDESRRYSRDEMLRAVAAKGFQASPRLVTDWVGLGLLDRPTRRGRGRGRGIEATWPENQLRLFLVLLGHRRRGVHVGPLANVPVWLWLAWGEDYVPLRQARRALSTWLAADEKAPANRGDFRIANLKFNSASR